MNVDESLDESMSINEIQDETMGTIKSCDESTSNEKN